MKAIEIKNLKKTYPGKQGPVDALKSISFSIEKGEFFGLLGPNGAGKSTFINILAGVTKKTSGDAIVSGISIDDDHPAAKHQLGIVPQEISFDAFAQVEESLNLEHGFFGKRVDQSYTDYILETLKLADKRKANLRSLSGGMKRRYMIARALMHKPEILILDEPTAGVDIELREDLYEFTRELNKQGTTIILTSHYLEEVELLCKRVAIIHKGELVALDDKEALKDRFQSTRIFSITLSSPIKSIPSTLAAFEPTINGAELELTFNEEDYELILSAVSNAKLPVANFKIIEPKLEDVFKSLTEK